jgi:hypothetical protein
MRKLLDARRTPSRPEVDEHDFSAQPGNDLLVTARAGDAK